MAQSRTEKETTEAYSAYVKHELGGYLSKTLAQIAKDKPEDPIDFLAQSLYQLKNSKMGSVSSKRKNKPKAEQAKMVTKVMAVNTMATDKNKAPGDNPGHADFSCLYSNNNAKWPIRCFAKLDCSVNAHHGGCAALALISCSYGGKGEETTAEVMFLRYGFDGNHISAKSVSKCHQGHFGASNSFETDEEGTLIGEHMFGTNHTLLLTNNGRYGNLVLGWIAKGDNETGSCDLPVNSNAGGGGGVTLLLCSGKGHGAVYYARHGFKDYAKPQQKLISGDDKWKFDINDSGILTASGVPGSSYSVFHNRDNLVNTSGLSKAQVCLTQATSGKHITTLLQKMAEHCSILVLCSSSIGPEDATVATMYHVIVESFKVKDCKEIIGSYGKGYKASDLWKFTSKAGRLSVTGPGGPCRYSLLTNITADTEDLVNSCHQTGCLATGEPRSICGSVSVNETVVSGVMDKPSKIMIQDNTLVVEVLEPHDLTKDPSDSSWSFERKWQEDEKTVGYHLVRVFAVREHVTSGIEQYIELKGSPCYLTRQKPGVLFALNCGGPAYQAISDITYASEHKLFASYKPGSRSVAHGGITTNCNIPQLLTRTHDGFLHATLRTPGMEAEDEQEVCYHVENMKNGDHILRLHLNSSRPTSVCVNGKDVQSSFKKSIDKKKRGDVIPGFSGYTTYVADIPVTVKDGYLNVVSKSTMICGFALLDKQYKDKTKTKEQIAQEVKVRQRLFNELEPLARTVIRKKMDIVGWSQNLLQNASGGAGNLSHWNMEGDWKVHEGGYGTERAFVTSHMECIKHQEVRLLDFFSADYLDTSPEIQVSEWYREGVSGGGYYSMDATLFDAKGKPIKTYSTGRIGKIYKDNKWMNASVTFSDYGPGVHTVEISSMGKDDKFWAGHFGPIISTSVIRVKRETQPAKDDKYEDISLNLNDVASVGVLEKVGGKVLSDNQDLMTKLIEEDNFVVDTAFEKQTAVAPTRKRMTKKRREIRVFVSSTFRDFKLEREQLIKKTFRQINRLCANRNVFFTYVDLRWGVTTEQTNMGKTIAICLQEIDRCRPYFLCMMGDRFGWAQREEEKDDLLNKSYDYAIENVSNLKWVDDYRYDASVTQLEIMHGVLNSLSEMKERSFFYLRAATDKRDVPEDKQKVYVAESDWHKDKQQRLRSMVRASNLNIRDYSDVQEVCDFIQQDLEWCLDQDFPKGTEPSHLEREKLAHMAFADVRCRVYIGRQEYFDSIDEHLENKSNKPLVLLGESGSGKSSLVANWQYRLGEREAETFLFVHFIGSSAESSSYLELLRRLYAEMKEFFGFTMVIPSSDINLVRDLPKWLHLAGSRSKCVIVLDALNQLDDGSGEEGAEHDLLWIPRELPHNVYMVLSTLPGRAMAAVQSTDWPTIKVEPLDVSQKEQIIVGYLEGIYGKTLNEEQKKMIIESPQTNNPLYLRSLLDEVRMYGSFRLLTDKIREYLTAGTPAELFSKILVRLEQDFESDRPGLVHDATTAIWCSHKGMSESELIELLDVHSAVWSPFYMSLAENLVNRNGILTFFHNHLKQAVENKYLNTPELKRKGYLTVANYFSEKELDDRVVHELPFLLSRSGEVERLKALISNLDAFDKLFQTEDGKFELINAWKLVTKGDYHQVDDAYVEKLENVPPEEQRTDSFLRLSRDVVDFFLELGLLNSAEERYKRLLTNLEERYAKSDSTVVYNAYKQSWTYKCQKPVVIDVLYQLGTVHEKQKEFDEAENVFMEAISRQNRIETPDQKIQLCEGLLGLATVYTLKSNMPEAKKLLARALELSVDVLGKRHHYVAAIFSKLGQLAYEQGRIDEALGYCLQDLKLTRSESGWSHLRMADVFNDIALVYDDKNDPLAASLYEASLAILLDTFGKSHLDIGTVRYNLGAVYFGTNYFSRAKFQFEAALDIFRTFLDEDHPDTVAAQTALEELKTIVK